MSGAPTRRGAPRWSARVGGTADAVVMGGSFRLPGVAASARELTVVEDAWAPADTPIVASIHSNRGIKRARAARKALGIPLDEPLPDLLGVVEDRAGVHVLVLDLADGVAG